MPTTRTLNQIISEFREIADCHLQINSFAAGSLDDFASSGDTKYPSLWVSFNGGTVASKETFRFSFWVVDRVKKDRSNLQEIFSDTRQIIKDIIAQLKDAEYKWTASVSVDLEEVFEPFNEDEVAGYVFQVEIGQHNEFSTCAIPYSSSPTVGRSANNTVTIVNQSGATVTTVAGGNTYTVTVVSVISDTIDSNTATDIVVDNIN